MVPVSPVHPAAMEWDSESVQSEDVFKQPENLERESKPLQPSTPQNQGGVRPHEFVSKTVRVQPVRGGGEHVSSPVRHAGRLTRCQRTAVYLKIHFYRSLSQSHVFPAERGSSLARFH